MKSSWLSTEWQFYYRVRRIRWTANKNHPIEWVGNEKQRIKNQHTHARAQIGMSTVVKWITATYNLLSNCIMEDLFANIRNFVVFIDTDIHDSINFGVQL